MTQSNSETTSDDIQRVAEDIDEIPGAKELKARIDKLETEIQQLQSKGLLGDPEFLARFSDEDRRKIIDILQDKPAGRGKDSDAAHSASVKISTPKEQRVYLQRLNGWLRQAERRGTDAENRRQMWKWYMRCRQNVPTFRAQLSEATWTTLWDTQAASAVSNPDRAAHVVQLAEDMRAGGRELNPRQRLAHIEALFLERRHDEALAEWDASEAVLRSTDGLEGEFLTLGVRMFARHGDAARAQEIARGLLSGKTKNYRILIDIIAAWTKIGGVLGFRHAWALYVRLRRACGAISAWTTTMRSHDASSRLARRI